MLRGVYTEIRLSFKVTGAELGDVVEVDYEIIHAGYWPLPYSSIELCLPVGDHREIVGAEGKLLKTQPAENGGPARVELLLVSH